MTKALLHESFYVAGAWSDESLGVYAGWVARKGSFDDGMPLGNERGDATLIFSGEEFPEPGTAQRLRERGHHCEVTGPSYLVHQYEEAPSFPAEWNGRFHGLVADRRLGKAILFNDRYGMHRLYYHESEDAFYFASEAKAILAVRPELRKINLRAMGEFIACGCALEGRSLFAGIEVLPPASVWVFRNGALAQKNTYFDPREWEEQEQLAPKDYYRKLRETFTRNLPRYFNSDQHIAMSLTGGLDTRMILANRKPEPGMLPCYTFGSMFRENQDVRVARRVAQACRQTHRVIVAGQEFLRQFARYAERAVYLTDGCADASRAPDLYVNEQASEIAPLRMTGNYGGEILRQVCAFKPAEPAAELFCPELCSSARQAAKTYDEHLCGHPVSFAAFKQGPWHHYGVLALEQTQLAMRSPYLDNDLVRTAFQSPAGALSGNEVSLRLIADGNRDLLRIPTDRGLLGGRGRLSEAAHHGLLEFLFKAEYACDMGMPQCLARFNHVLAPLRPERMFLGRHKVFHFRVWYRDALAGYVQDMLLDERSLSRPHVERKAVAAVVRCHLQGDRNYTNELHKLLTLELIHRLFLDNCGEGLSAMPCAAPDLQFDHLATAETLVGGAGGVAPVVRG